MLFYLELIKAVLIGSLRGLSRHKWHEVHAILVTTPLRTTQSYNPCVIHLWMAGQFTFASRYSFIAWWTFNKMIDTLRTGQNGRHFRDNLLHASSWMNITVFWLICSSFPNRPFDTWTWNWQLVNFVLGNGLIPNIHYDDPVFPTHLFVTKLQCFNMTTLTHWWLYQIAAILQATFLCAFFVY